MFVGANLSIPYNNTFPILAILCLLASLKSSRYVGIVLACVAGTLLGTWRIGEYTAQQSLLSPFVGREVSIIGRVSDDPSVGSKGDTRLRLVIESINNNKVPNSELWVSLAKDALIKRSDTVGVHGLLSSGFGTFTAVMYRAEIEKVSRSDYGDIARDVRDSFASSVRRGIDEPEGSLAVGFLLGQKSELPEKLQNDLRLLGLTHIVVASGYNLTVLVRFSRRFFMRISRFTALATSIGFIYLFVQMTGYTPSMTRASLIATLSLLAWYVGRTIHPFVLIPFSASLTLLYKPAYANGDIGWLLSFASFIGVIVCAPLLHSYFWGDRKANFIRQIVIETLSAQLLTIPIIVATFGTISPLSLPANILVVPLIPVIMLFSFFGGFVGLFSTVGAGLFALPAEILLKYIIWVVDRISINPIASKTVTVGIEQIIIFYIIITICLLHMWRHSSHDFQKINFIE